MTLLLSCHSLSKSYAGTKPLFSDLALSIFSGDRIGLVGLNGCGKSTFLKILANLETADSGTVAPRRGLRIGYVPQSCEFPDITPTEVLLRACDKDIPSYEQTYIVEKQLSLLGFSGNEPSAARLSGGWKKRLRIAVELINSPDLLLLDEPTNHLDLEGVLYLEEFLQKEAQTYLLVSHDRSFLENVTNKIFEIGSIYPTGFFSTDGSYNTFLERKQTFLEGQIQREKGLATKARRETAWLKAGVKARGTKAQSRINEAHEILDTHADIRTRNKQTRTTIDFESTARQSKKLLTFKNISKTLGDKTLFSNLDLILSPGSRIGLMGPNGSGKTTLLKLLANELAPDTGTIKLVDGVQIIYFDQHRSQLPEDIPLKKALAPRGDFVSFRGNDIHVNSWCKRFLFPQELLEMPISSLSGGERARIAIAHLMLQPADILLLDEPTNDLDIPTLEALEESLLEFPGAIVLITHDRSMINRVCTSILSLDKTDKVQTFADYQKWEDAQKKPKSPKKPQNKKPTQSPSTASKKKRNSIEKKITKLEAEVHTLNHLLEKDEIASNPQRLEEICKEIGTIETAIEEYYLQLERLENEP